MPHTGASTRSSLTCLVASERYGMAAPVVTALLSSASVPARVHPQALVLACMDARLHVEKVLGIANGGHRTRAASLHGWGGKGSP